MYRTTIYIDDALFERLKRQAELTGQTQSSFIRAAVESALERDEAMPYPRSVGLADTGPQSQDPSELVDQVAADGFGRDDW